MAEIHTQNALLAYASKSNIAYPKPADGGLLGTTAKTLVDALLTAEASDFPSAATAATGTVPQDPAADATSPTRLQLATS